MWLGDPEAAARDQGKRMGGRVYAGQRAGTFEEDGSQRQWMNQLFCASIFSFVIGHLRGELELS